MTVPKEIFYLVDRFDRNHEAYQSGKYKETQLRREFIDPFTTKPFCSARSDATDSQIDRLVYELYELTEEEVGIVEDI
jgi:hypothetical protein